MHVVVAGAAVAAWLLIPGDAKGRGRETWRSNSKAAVQAVGLAWGDLLNVLLSPARLVRVQYGLTADGRQTADDQGCPKPGQEHDSAQQASVRG